MKCILIKTALILVTLSIIISACHKKEKIVPVETITISASSAELTIGETLQLTATISPSTATDKTIGWNTSNASIATVSPTGLVNAVAEGNCSIIATCNGKTATCMITVKKPVIPVSSIELDKTDIKMYVGDNETLTATVKPDDASDKTVTWASSKPAIATVDNNGNIKAIADGIAIITASCGGKTASCKVSVKILTYEESYFTIRGLESGTLKWNVENVEYSLDRKNWKPWSGSLSFQKDDAFLFRAEKDSYEDKSIESTGKINVEGNILSLLYGKEFIDKKTLRKSSSMPEYIFKGLFRDNDRLISGENLIILAADVRGCYNELFQNCSQMTIGPNITVPKVEVNSCRAMFAYCISLAVAPKLPSTDLSYFCYCDMFRNCKSLTTAPELPATTVPQSAYNSMFYDCSALTKAPDLPAKNIGTQAYRFMFHYCTSLTEAPALPATTLAKGCYELMFRGTSIYEAPELPATTLAENCYGSMFSFCPNLRKAPVLPAKVLVKGCYSTMFIGTPINYIKCLAEDVSAEDCTTAWLGHMYGTGPASAGTFIKSSSMNSWPTGDNGIPEGWTVINAD